MSQNPTSWPRSRDKWFKIIILWFFVFILQCAWSCLIIVLHHFVAIISNACPKLNHRIYLDQPNDDKLTALFKHTVCHILFLRQKGKFGFCLIPQLYKNLLDGPFRIITKRGNASNFQIYSIQNLFYINLEITESQVIYIDHLTIKR